MPFSRERLRADCERAAGLARFARRGERQGVADRLQELGVGHLHRRHHASAESERRDFASEEPDLVAPLDRFDAALGAVLRRTPEEILAGPGVLDELSGAAEGLRRALEGGAQTRDGPDGEDWLSGSLTELSHAVFGGTSRRTRKEFDELCGKGSILFRPAPQIGRSKYQVRVLDDERHRLAKLRLAERRRGR